MDVSSQRGWNYLFLFIILISFALKKKGKAFLDVFF